MLSLRFFVLEGVAGVTAGGLQVARSKDLEAIVCAAAITNNKVEVIGNKLRTVEDIATIAQTTQ